jgi:carbamoylphosphate synthase large subunit
MLKESKTNLSLRHEQVLTFHAHKMFSTNQGQAKLFVRYNADPLNQDITGKNNFCFFTTLLLHVCKAEISWWVKILAVAKIPV